MDYKQINWLASYPKSGNTWVRCFLDAYFLGDLDINDIICSVSDNQTTVHLPGDGSDPSTYPIDVQMLTRPMAMLRLVRQYNLNEMAKPPLFVKTHNANMLANGVEMLPLALTNSTTYLIRDPRDVIQSFAKHLGLDMDEAISVFFEKQRVLQDNSGNRMGDFIASWPTHAQSFVNNDSHNVLVIKYEDLKADPHKWFSLLLKHSGVNPDSERVSKAIDMTELSRLKKMEKEKGFKESSPFAKDQFFGGGKTGEWDLTPAQLHRIEKGCSSMLKRFYDVRKAA